MKPQLKIISFQNDNDIQFSLDITNLKRCSVLSQRHFLKGDFPSGNLSSCNIPIVKFHKRQLSNGQVRSSEGLQAAMEAELCGQDELGGPARTGWGPIAAARTDLGSCHLGKLHIWEVAIWENTLGKIPFGKLPLGKNPLVKYLFQSFLSITADCVIV